MATIRVQEADFDVSAELAALTAGRTDIGGIGCFVGTVRDAAAGRPIAAMTLEHYPAMTERAIRPDHRGGGATLVIARAAPWCTASAGCSPARRSCWCWPRRRIAARRWRRPAS